MRPYLPLTRYLANATSDNDIHVTQRAAPESLVISFTFVAPFFSHSMHD